mmetsp:Transcript_43362/g.68652  ORF Transcript_43362/g.68652 Transcript_43362/m.68652 type:complete len:503 (-) Transcript_43362:210-1718(-)
MCAGASWFALTCLSSIYLIVDCATTISPLPSIHTAPASVSPHFFDEYGRVRIFHGSNRVWKAKPWYFEDMLQSDKEFDLMKQMGFNVMRLGWMWSGFNPAPGVFNQTYADIIKTIVEKMNARGIYVLLDMHEDVLSSKFCLYDGMPQWVVNKSSSKHAFPWPLKGNCSSRGWMENTLSEAAATAYQDLYDNKNGMLDDLSAFWVESARQFKDIPGVFYEIINEPFAGNFYEHPTVLLPGVAGRRNLQPMYDKVSSAIREVDDSHVIFYEPVTWGMIFEGKIVGSGFQHVPGGPEWVNKSALSFHYYCATFVPSFGKEPFLRKVVCDDVTKPLVFKAIDEDLKRLGGSAMMTEGLACDASTPKSAGECSVVMDSLDKHLFSWTDYGVSQGATWTPSLDQQRAWARTFARAVAGTPINMTFNGADPQHAFEFCFSIDTRISAPTEIFVSTRYHYVGGPQISTTPNLKYIHDDLESDVVLLVPSSGADIGEVGCVRMQAKSTQFV